MVNALGEIGDTKAVEPLASLLSDETIRLEVIEALGKIGSAEALGHLARMLHESQDSATFGACLKAIGQALESQPDEKLLKNIGSWALLSSPAAAVRRATVMALSRFPSRVVMRHLVAAAKDSDIPVRRAVVEALAQYADLAARAALARCCLDLDPEVASAAWRHTETAG